MPLRSFGIGIAAWLYAVVIPVVMASPDHISLTSSCGDFLLSNCLDNFSAYSPWVDGEYD